MDGISNFQIENAFKKISDPDLLDNFVGVFPSNYMNKFINHAAMIDKFWQISLYNCKHRLEQKTWYVLVEHTRY